MADEKEQPISQQGEEPTPIDPATAPEPLKRAQAKTIREMRAETVAPEQIPGPFEEIREGETRGDVRARRELEDALNKPIEAVEDALNTLDHRTTPRTAADVLPHAVPDYTDVPFIGRVNLPIYDIVFISLFIFTVVEVILAEVFDAGWLLIFVLLAMAFVKALHVIYFYMHLRDDSRIFWATLLIPFAIAAIGLMYLVAVPATGY